jgi:cyanuric acid amidohydrolase
MSRVTKTGVWKIAMAAPNDVSQLQTLIEAKTIAPEDIIAVIGKTEGNGGANDFTRGYATLSFQQLLARHLNTSIAGVAERIVFVWSGGTEGVLSPHATIITRSEVTNTSGEKPSLAVGTAVSRNLGPEEVGTGAQINEVAATVTAALADAGIVAAADVHYVQVKGPLLTPSSIEDADRRGVEVVTRDPNGSKGLARGAMALGVAVALGELSKEVAVAALASKDMSRYSRVAATSAGGELSNCEVIVFGNSVNSRSEFRIGHATLKDVIDADGVRACLESAGLHPNETSGVQNAVRVAVVFAKAEASPTGRVRGWRNTMLSDADINYERHARAALGAVIASITSDPAIFVSGGTEHQCAPGEAPIAAIVRS